MSAPLIRIEGLSKSFVLHNQGGVELPVFRDIDLEVFAGECLALHGPSGTGKSSLIRLIYGNYLCPQGRILVRHEGRVTDVARALPHEILDLRRRTMGYVSQFLSASFPAYLPCRSWPSRCASKGSTRRRRSGRRARC